ncbi:EvpB family type VI secretion protein [Bordetella genomosp. 8]|uniref:EvpB family type VI secretion protein n=1 Tax=Bordetella genomosp. 8 TaxID=1416806 RepID=A0A1W6YQS8_9BORD|nr:type VI secretion system contractile sheath large subunit [Bordetella genomosp. 8]ARP83351.1 EvpB family type VI secretion protein [Bordetella genomosp. 8]
MSEAVAAAEQAKGQVEIEGASSDFSSLLLKEFKPKNDEAKRAVEQSITTLAEYALKDATLISADVMDTVQAMIAEIDRKLTLQINGILNCAEFRSVEGAWRGLHYLVSNTETSEQMKIRVMNVSKTDLHKTLKKYKGSAWDQSPFFKKIYEEEFGQFGGQPYGALVGDYYFDNSARDVDLLTQIARICAASHTPFFAGASPSVMLLESWRDLANPRDINKLFQTPEHAAWRALRESEDSRYIGLTLPRFLARTPYGARSNPVDEFAFEEDTGSGEPERFTWANAAYAMAVNINRSFIEYGWCSRIRGVESGGAVDGLPVHMFPTDDGGVDVICPTEVVISDRREAELSKAGFLPLVHMKNSGTAAFIGAQSLQLPTEYDDPEATANANLSARLPYLFACCRFAHYLKCIARDKIGSFKTKEEMQRWLYRWILKYMDGMPTQSSEFVKAMKPLSDAAVTVEEVEGNPGFYTSKIYLKPHYQLEGLTVSLRLVSKLPAVEGK